MDNMVPLNQAVANVNNMNNRKIMSYEHLAAAYQQQVAINQQNLHIIQQMQQEIANLNLKLQQPQLQDVAGSSKCINSDRDSTTQEYGTDEEELENEFQSPSKQDSKKRKRIQKNPVLIHSQPVPTHAKESKEKRIHLPPPINVSNVGDVNLFRELLTQAADEISAIRFKAINNNDIKITCKDEKNYRLIKEKLHQMKSDQNSVFQQTEFHTYQLKSERLFRFVIRGLCPSTKTELIKSALEEKGHNVVNITNVRKKSVVEGLKKYEAFPLFYVDISPSDTNKTVYDIDSLLNFDVKIESPKVAKSIPQCTNCQQLGHTKGSCYRQSRCVKCAGPHHTTTCQKERNSVATCALCGEKGHPANYKGCPVYQAKQKSLQPRKQTVTQRLQTKNPLHKQQTENPTAGRSNVDVKEKSADRQKKVKNQIADAEPTITDLMNMMHSFQAEFKQAMGQLSNRVEKLEKAQKPSNKKSNKKNE